MGDNDELDFQVAQDIKNKNHDCKKGAIKSSQRAEALWKHKE